MIMDGPPTAPATSGTLDRCAVGSTATISGVGGEWTVRRRLLEMGLCPGVTVTVIRRAPLGDPIELRVRGYLLSIRGDQARLVQIAC